VLLKLARAESRSKGSVDAPTKIDCVHVRAGGPRWSGRLAMVIPQHPAQTLAASDPALYLPDFFARLQDPVGHALVIPLTVAMGEVLPSQPSPNNWQIGFRDCSFGACSAFIHIRACLFAKSPWEGQAFPRDLFAPETPTALLPLPSLRLLPAGTSQLPGGGSHPMELHRRFMAYSIL